MNKRKILEGKVTCFKNQKKTFVRKICITQIENFFLKKEDDNNKISIHRLQSHKHAYTCVCMGTKTYVYF